MTCMGSLYSALEVSVLAFQTCQRAIEARKRFRRRKESKATIKIQPTLLFIVSAVIGFLAAHCIWNGEVKPLLKVDGSKSGTSGQIKIK
ncbi:signal peptide peptidase [Artemisia annua]|uniref:Signal peptide peptidase n=1 Tax=Artemisia annua TaxID=35608 RepID=A0A2U1KBM9_ARTAN|nr:signal peptide peptidase [Artemisia annua]